MRPHTATLLILLSGCQTEFDDGLGTRQGALVAENGLSTNALTKNALTKNALTLNALTKNALSTLGLATNSAVDAVLKDPSQGADAAMLIKYSARCMLTPAQSVTVKFRAPNGALKSATYAGNLGLQPEWLSRGLTDSEIRWWGACLAAHTNATGKAVSFSVTGPHPAFGDGWRAESEAMAYDGMEGAFFADYNPTANPPLHFYSCHDSVDPDGTGWNARVCATDDTACGAMFTMVGPCWATQGADSELCEILPNDSPLNGLPYHGLCHRAQPSWECKRYNAWSSCVDWVVTYSDAPVDEVLTTYVPAQSVKQGWFK
jgi:hypothetical protein